MDGTVDREKRIQIPDSKRHNGGEQREDDELALPGQGPALAANEENRRKGVEFMRDAHAAAAEP